MAGKEDLRQLSDGEIAALQAATNSTRNALSNESTAAWRKNASQTDGSGRGHWRTVRDSTADPAERAAINNHIRSLNDEIGNDL